MKALALAVIAIPVVGCEEPATIEHAPEMESLSSSTTSVAEPLPVSDDELIHAFSKLQEGMTYEEVCNIVPAVKACRPYHGEHGGAWFGVDSLGGYAISLRFEHSIDGPRSELGTKKLADCRINHPPALSDPNRVLLR